jgi:hypothetical protein
MVMILRAASCRLVQRARTPRAQSPAAPVGLLATVTLYTDDEILVGELVAPLPRASEPLAELMPIALRHVLATRLTDGRSSSIAERVVGPQQVVAVSVGAEGSAPGATRRHHVTLRTGPYFVQGSVKSVAVPDLMTYLRHHSRIELWDSVIEYVVAGRRHRDVSTSLHVTRSLVESIAEAPET